MKTIGIDLGTTNSLIAYWQDGEAKLIANSLSQTLTPSVVGLDDKGQIIVGEVARQRLETHPTSTIAAFKRFMGTNKEFTLAKKKFRAEELSALILKSLVADAEAFFGEKISSAVISVPAYFSDAQRKATHVAGELAGLEVKRLINEPTAAAIAYGLHENDDESTILVFDIGGGTFDVSIMEMFDGVMQVNATAGDNHLGGEDFVDALKNNFLHEHGLRWLALDVKDQAKVAAAMESVKKQLTSNESVKTSVSLNKADYAYTVTRDSFTKICRPLLDRLRTPLERAVKDAALDTEDIDAVVLVGGASRMPIVRLLVSKMLGKIPRTHINPDEIVALGAAIQAGLVSGNAELKDIVLTDVAPYTLGIGINDHNDKTRSRLIMSPIIERNSPVPISREERYCNAEDFQTKVNIKIYQGEARHVDNNIELGSVDIEIPRSKAGEGQFIVRFTYDVSGLLEVDVEVESTANKINLVIQGNASSMSKSEIAKRLSNLESLKVHPRNQMKNALLMARGERLYEINRGEMRDYIGQLLSQFEVVLGQQNVIEIDKAEKEIGRLLDEIDGNSPLHS
jgi:molecular chaperone HscC